MSALAIIVCVLMTATAFYGCGNEDTATADTASKISTPDTPDTVQTTAAVTTVESTTKSHDEYGIDYPEYAVNLAKMSLPEVIELMGGDFEVKLQVLRITLSMLQIAGYIFATKLIFRVNGFSLKKHRINLSAENTEAIEMKHC